MKKSLPPIYFLFLTFIVFIIIKAIQWQNIDKNFEKHTQNQKYKNQEDKSQENKNMTIGKYISQTADKKQNYIIYHLNNKEYKANIGILPPEITTKDMGKFYRITYSENYEDIIKIEPNQEVTDTTEIILAGFTKYDIGKAAEIFFDNK
jgi:hypothetical protein